jgi:hypothetical protein
VPRSLRLAYVALVFMFAASTVGADEQPDPLAGFVGTWEYRQENSAAPGGYDDVGERLEMTRRGNELRIVYFGVEREAEHGLYFSVVEAESVAANDEGRVEFVVPERRYHDTRPSSLRAERSGSSNGCCAEVLEYSGQLVGDELRLACRQRQRGYSLCPDSTVVFRRGPWSPPPLP